ncbi:hypothetical protein BVI2075_960020 [Burkholderia vietnamiensis]|nr:hypothetical protein BVI2075_960020 [Burkholderia vietnamiensis]
MTFSDPVPLFVKVTRPDVHADLMVTNSDPSVF